METKSLHILVQSLTNNVNNFIVQGGGIGGVIYINYRNLVH
jgi:hypothetical protein